MEDLIKRSDAIKAIWAEGINPSEDGMVFEAQSHIDRDIRLIPSADRTRGEWIGEADGYADGEPVYDTWYCSNCDYVVDDDEPPTWNYCPNCGARMKGADDEASD